MEKLISIVTKLGITIGLSLVIIFMTIRVVAETPIEPQDRPNPPEDPCWYVDIPCELND